MSGEPAVTPRTTTMRMQQHYADFMAVLNERFAGKVTPGTADINLSGEWSSVVNSYTGAEDGYTLKS